MKEEEEEVRELEEADYSFGKRMVVSDDDDDDDDDVFLFVKVKPYLRC